MRFWDTSALVCLAVEQARSKDADLWYREDPELVVWTLTLVEGVSAIHRLARERRIDASGAGRAESQLRTLLLVAHTVSDVPSVKESAIRRLHRHALRAADALQLAAALLWSEGDPFGRVFHTFDDRLGRAAHAEGFLVVPAPTD